MRRPIRLLALLSFAVAASAAAQAPVPPARPSSAPAAKLLLANTGELALTDAQVVRLAAIARRSEARRASLRSAMDSARRRFQDQTVDTAARRQFRQRMQADVERAREQSRTDQRDAIAVLTPDQQAKAWEMVANRGRGGAMRGDRGGMRRGDRGGMMRGRMMRGGDRGPGMRRGFMRDGDRMREPRSPRSGMPGDRPMRPLRPSDQ